MLEDDRGQTMRQILELQICREIIGLCSIQRMDQVIKTWDLQLYSQARK